MRLMVVVALLLPAAAGSRRGDETNTAQADDRPLPLTAPFDSDEAKAAQAAWAESLGRPVIFSSTGMELVLIPPGTFRMGSPEAEALRSNDETQVEVTLTRAFYLGKTEVTQGQWRAVMGTTPWKEKSAVPKGDNYPAVDVTWDDANAFCVKLAERDGAGFRLPTEAEWEFACRAGQTMRFSFGHDEARLGKHAWYAENATGRDGAHEVGLKKANAFGLFDMHGNVWEWCADAYPPALTGGVDPRVKTGLRRIDRGGGWNYPASECRSACRNGLDPSYRLHNLGFRVAWSQMGVK